MELEPKDNDHLLFHIKERYYVPTIALKSLIEQKYGNVLIVIQLINHDLEKGKKPYWLEHSLTRYFRKRKMDMVDLIIDRGQTVDQWKPEPTESIPYEVKSLDDSKNQISLF